MGVSTNLGAKINRRKRAVRIDPDVMENVGAEGGNEGDWVSLEVRDMGNETEEVTFDEFFLGNSRLFSAVIDNCVLVQVAVDDVSAGGVWKRLGKRSPTGTSESRGTPGKG